MLAKVLRYIQKHNMLEPGQKVVVGVSGGADSMALIHLLGQIRDQIPLSLVVVHINHGIRGKAAEEDAAFVENFARAWDLKCFIKEAQVPRLAREWGVSEEEAGRKVRYDFFEEVRRQVGGHRIALAHHRDDQAETILHNIIRGTGLGGLSGIKPVRDGLIIRPLLQVSRQEIENYCHIHGIEYRDDHTNEEVIYTRNRIRHRLIPMIEEHFNPNFSETIVRMGDLLRDDEEFLLHYSQEAFSQIAHQGQGEIKISLSGFNRYPRAVQGRIIRRGLELLKKNLMGMEQIHIESVVDLAQALKVGSTLDLPEGIKAWKDYEYLVLSMEKAQGVLPDFQYELKVPGRVFIPEIGVEISAEYLVASPEDFMDNTNVLDRSNRCIYIDVDAIKGGLCVRNRRSGDRFKPLGLGGTKKLKDFFIDNKIPRHKRDSIPLVLDRDNIIWVAGYQMNDDYKITRQTKRLLKLKIND